MHNRLFTEQCCGCNACYNICPVGAISMEENSEGFLFPVINQEKCVNCGKCERVCPAINKKEVKERDIKTVYAAMANDEIRYNSSSGGIFTLIANYILENSGYVSGAAFSEDFKKVEHIIISSKEDLHKLQTSKYVQSDIGNVFKEIKELLNSEKEVLFTGTPCQVQGLKSFLGKEYKNLYTADVLCHGAPSPAVWRDYLNLKFFDKTFEKVNFRDKKYGWKSPLILSLKSRDGYNEYTSKENIYYQSFLKNLILRKSCGTCLYTNLDRPSDITLGDFWKIQKFDKKLNDKKGTSLVMVNSDKGQYLFEKIKSRLISLREVPIKFGIRGNAVLKQPSKMHCNRDLFFLKYKKGELKSMVKLMESCLENEIKYDGIISNLWYNCNNYGAVLTAYALQQYFRSKGLDYRLLNLKTKKNKKSNSTLKIRDFVKKNLSLTRLISSFKELEELNYLTDTFIVGSDQVFKDHCIRKFTKMFTLSYTDFSKKRIAFSASFGKDSFDTDEVDTYILSKFFKRFDAISVREKSGVDICKDKFGIEANHILDPVFIAEKENFTKLIDTKSQKYKNKLVYYVLDTSKKIRESIDKLSKELGVETENITYQNLSIEDFLTAINDSEYFITDSFHGCCFALLFHKKFLTLKNDDRGLARFDSLIDTFDISNCFVKMAEEITLENLNKSIVNWDKFEKVLSKEKKNTEKWVEKYILTPKTVTEEQIINEQDFVKYLKSSLLFKNRLSAKKWFFSVKKNSVRIEIRVLGLKIKIKRK